MHGLADALDAVMANLNECRSDVAVGALSTSFVWNFPFLATTTEHAVSGKRPEEAAFLHLGRLPRCPGCKEARLLHSLASW